MANPEKGPKPEKREKGDIPPEFKDLSEKQADLAQFELNRRRDLLGRINVEKFEFRPKELDSFNLDPFEEHEAIDRVLKVMERESLERNVEQPAGKEIARCESLTEVSRVVAAFGLDLLRMRVIGYEKFKLAFKAAYNITLLAWDGKKDEYIKGIPELVGIREKAAELAEKHTACSEIENIEDLISRKIKEAENPTEVSKVLDQYCGILAEEKKDGKQKIVVYSYLHLRILENELLERDLVDACYEKDKRALNKKARILERFPEAFGIREKYREIFEKRAS